MLKRLLACKSDTTIGETVNTMSELGPDVWELEQATLRQMSRDSLAWYAGLAEAQLQGPVYWTLLDITYSTYPHLGAPVLESGVWE